VGRLTKLEAELRRLGEEAELATSTAAGLAEEGRDEKAMVAGLEAVALELRALRLAVLSREPVSVKWWW
jgi:hypothetical protein